MNDPTRNKDLSRIHIAKAKLGLDDETYRDMLKSLTGATSAKDLDYKQRWRVIKEMEKHLPSDKRLKAPKKGYPQRPAVIDHKEAQIGKIEALLAEMGLPWSYANKIAQNQTRHEFPPNGVTLVEWCNSEQLRGVITALNNHKKRLDAKAAQAVGHD